LPDAGYAGPGRDRRYGGIRMDIIRHRCPIYDRKAAKILVKPI
jgi:hypothetical protein